MFKKWYCHNKADVQRDFQKYMEQYAPDPEDLKSELYKQMHNLCIRFQQALENCSLPILTDDWWYYDYALTNDGIDLRLYYCEEFNLDEGGELESSTSTEEFTLLSVKCDYFTVDQFAKLNDVSDITVRQWIRRGKLRTARKVGRDWLIPVIAPKPTRGFRAASYQWERLPVELSDSFPFLEGYDYIYIFKNKEVRNQFEGILGYPGQSNRMKIVLSTKDREKLELALISSGTVSVEEF
ncbi:helix-turn-helix domain-containing protein [Paenibacillus sp. MMS20-IR301]|uniref:helix-turn-helix domain-containing protein n=1 Tax=Paenibacillus sp. MMS20-IR301 TaxID=2895946 RepID=UPI0028E63746|nr:helix-turn-helix domain-containing protein [Paenibacillus sp. MMS20-IR301]WNS42068.1 helix-turn-helix domain-containing protein [Paenibacillus sp. MMS20-IR301]